MPPADHPPPSDLVVVCASPDDRRWLVVLRRHLVAFQDRRALTLWERGDVRPGDSWEVAQRAAWEGACATLLLVSPQLLAEDLAPGGETQRRVAAMRARGAPVVWLATSYSAYRHTELAEIEPLCDPERPLDGLDEAEVQRVLVGACERLLAALPGASPAPAEAPRSAPRAPLLAALDRHRRLALGLGLGVVGLLGASALVWRHCGVDAPAQEGRVAPAGARDLAGKGPDTETTPPAFVDMAVSSGRSAELAAGGPDAQPPTEVSPTPGAVDCMVAGDCDERDDGWANRTVSADPSPAASANPKNCFSVWGLKNRDCARQKGIFAASDCEARGGHTGGVCAGVWLLPPLRVVGAGASHLCLVPTDGSLLCWGANLFYYRRGALGYGDRSDRYGAPGFTRNDRVEVGGVVREVDGGAGHTCALLSEGRVRCWGRNDAGQLGYGHRDDFGDDPGEMPTLEVAVGAPTLHLALGATHTCALVEGGAVRCWGAGEGARGPNAASIGDALYEMPPPPISGITSAIQVVGGEHHSCALLQGGAVKCWGGGAGGVLGNGSNTGIDAGPESPAPPDVNLGGEVVQLAASGTHTCALLKAGGVRCWGNNHKGQLGVGHTENVGNEPGEMPPADVAIRGRATQIVTGKSHACALLESGKIRCWGDGELGALGNGTSDPVGDQPDEPPVEVAMEQAATRLVGHHGYFTCAQLVDGLLRCWGAVPW